MATRICSSTTSLCHGLRRAAVLCFCVLAAYTLQLQAQIGINADGATPHPASLLDVNADGLPANTKKGLLLPSVPLIGAAWLSAISPYYGGPFYAYHTGSNTAPNMPQALWIYNSATTAMNNQFAPQNVSPGLYVFDENHTTDFSAARWLKQQAKVLAPQHHLGTGSTTLVGSTWTNLPGLSSVALQLKAGDRVLYSGNGAFQLAPPVAPSTTSGYAVAGARIAVSGTVNATLKTTVASAMNDASLLVGTTGCIIIWCAGNTGYYTTTLRTQSWRLLGAYDVPADGTYTFYIQTSLISGTASVISGSDGITRPELRGTFSLEVIRP